MTVRSEQRGVAAWLTIDREERRNALSGEVIGGLVAGLAAAASDEAVRAVVITGAGDRAFCAGGDIGGFQAADASAESAPTAIARLMDALWHHPKPTIARVNGRALGGGFGLMLACDLAVAADDIEVGTPEIDIGLWPHVITAVIQRRVPRAIALEMMLTGRRLSTEEAARWGMVNRVVARPKLDAAVEDLVSTLAAKSPYVLRLGKRAFTGAEDQRSAGPWSTSRPPWRRTWTPRTWPRACQRSWRKELPTGRGAESGRGLGGPDLSGWPRRPQPARSSPA